MSGFRLHVPQTAIAFLDGDHFSVERVGTTWESREAQIPCDFRPTVIDSDGTLLSRWNRRAQSSSV
jgi:hypothetical protein